METRRLIPIGSGVVWIGVLVGLLLGGVGGAQETVATPQIVPPAGVSAPSGQVPIPRIQQTPVTHAGFPRRARYPFVVTGPAVVGNRHAR